MWGDNILQCDPIAGSTKRPQMSRLFARVASRRLWTWWQLCEPRSNPQFPWCNAVELFKFWLCCGYHCRVAKYCKFIPFQVCQLCFHGATSMLPTIALGIIISASPYCGILWDREKLNINKQCVGHVGPKALWQQTSASAYKVSESQAVCKVMIAGSVICCSFVANKMQNWPSELKSEYCSMR